MRFTYYIGFAETVLQKGIRAAAEYAAKMGFDSVEMLEMARPDTPAVFRTTDEAAKAREILAEYGLTTACYSVGAALYRSPEAEASLIRHAEIAAALGSPYLHHTLIGSPAAVGSPTFDEALPVLTEAAGRVACRANELGLTCLYEDQGPYINGIEGFGAFYREMKHSGAKVAVCGDIGNCLFVDTEPADFFRAFADEIVHVHIKDYIRKSGDTAPGKDWRHTPGGNWLRDTVPGSGCVDFAACMDILKKAGYAGPYSLELTHPEPYDYGVRQTMELLTRLA